MLIGGGLTGYRASVTFPPVEVITTTRQGTSPAITRKDLKLTMKKYVVSIMALVALSALIVVAQSVDGKWTRETQGKAGPQTQTLTLKNAGGKLTGTLEGGGGKGAPAEISEGTVTGNNVSFKIVREFGGNSVTQTYTGTVSATELKLTVEGGGGGGKGGGKGPQEMVFKR